MIKSTRFRMVKLLYNMVRFYPEGNYFAPFGKKSSEIEEIEVRVDEIEAIRLKDVEGLTIEECASKMAISCETFQNIIQCARKKIAIALTQQKIISISEKCTIFRPTNSDTRPSFSFLVFHSHNSPLFADNSNVISNA